MRYYHPQLKVDGEMNNANADDTTRRPLERMAVILSPSENAARDFKCAVAAFGGNIIATPDSELGAAASNDDPCKIITMSDAAVNSMLDATEREH